MNYEELVKALRICGKGDCVDCDRQRQDKCLKRYWNNENLIDGMLCEAAAAIEALLESVGMLGEQRSYWIDKAAEYYNQLPKHGEWIEENRRPRSSQFVCSECHRTAYDPQPTRDKAWRKRCRYAYCPNCGAKMEVQE